MAYKKISCIYKISSIIKPHKFYIGSTIIYGKRKNRHLNMLKFNTHPNIILQNHYNKYGFEDILFEIIEEIKDTDKLIEREQYYLDTLDPLFNIAKTAYSPMSGRKHTQETKDKMSLSRKGKKKPPFTEEHKENIRISKLGNNNCLNRICSEETKELHRTNAIKQWEKIKSKNNERTAN